MMGERRKRAIELRDLLSLRWAMEPAIDRSGTRVAFVSAGFDAGADRLDGRVHVIDVASGATLAVQSDAPTRRPRWSPDGTRLAVRTLVEDRWQPAVLDSIGAAPAPIAVDGDVGAFDWAGDGTRLVCQLRHAPGSPRVLCVVGVSDGDSRPLAPDVPETWCGAWAPEGDRVAFCGRTGDGTAGVWTVDTVRSVQPSLLASGWADILTLAWAPDGTTLALIVEPDAATPWANRELWVVDTETGECHQLGAGLDRSIGQVVRGDDERGLGPPSLHWSTDGTTLLALVADGGSSSIYAFEVDGTEGMPLPASSGAVLEFDLASDTGTVAYTWSDPLTPGEVSVHFTDGSRQRCSDLSASLRDEVLVAPTHRVGGVTGDGQHIEGWLTMPHGDTGADHPLVVQVHGGPHYPVGERFSFDAQRLAGLGVAVLRANPRGSQGHGQRFAAAIAGDWGGGDVDDLLDLLDHVAAIHPVDPQRFGVIGESYGAFVALTAIARTDRFVCAVAENSVADLDAAIQRQPVFWRAELGLDGDQSGRRVRSPLEQVSRMETPLLLIHAEDDVVSPIAQSEALVAALGARGRPAELVRVAGEGHFVNVTGRPSRRLDKLERMDAFLRQHLAKEALAPA
jgi:dipeptidyl aminopeptidase/acylaminoacyl peptidase